MSSLGPWTISPSVGGSVAGGSEAQLQIDRLRGLDIWFDVVQGDGADYVVTPAGDWKVAEGFVALRQWIIRTIITDPGEWATLPDYGVGARLFVKNRNTASARDELKERIRGQLLRDPRIEDVKEVFVEILSDSVRIAVTVIPTGRELQHEAVRAAVEVS